MAGLCLLATEPTQALPGHVVIHDKLMNRVALPTMSGLLQLACNVVLKLSLFFPHKTGVCLSRVYRACCSGPKWDRNPGGGGLGEGSHMSHNQNPGSLLFGRNDLNHK